MGKSFIKQCVTFRVGAHMSILGMLYSDLVNLLLTQQLREEKRDYLREIDR